jgi:hypothetical protein
MKQAGFSEVFLGIENPDPAALKGMNKKQNVRVDIADVVAQIQREGIEVMAGFIFGSDEDTIETADAIAAFAQQVAIPTAMTGMLTPIPYTPLAERLRAEGRLREAEFSGNNTDDEVQFVPRRMTMEEMQQGYYTILRQLFSPGAMYERSIALIERLEPHIFHGRNTKLADVRAALRSVWQQGVLHGPRRAYYRLLARGFGRDAEQRDTAARALADLDDRQRASSADGHWIARFDSEGRSTLVERAREAAVRAWTGSVLRERLPWDASIEERIRRGEASAADARSLDGWAREYFTRQRRIHRFPGAYLVKAFNLAIKGLHYEIVMNGIAPESRAVRDGAVSTALS